MTDTTHEGAKAPEEREAPATEAGNEAAATEGAQGTGKARGALPPLDFTTFILSLSSSVLMNLGLVENPVTKKTEKELPVAKQTIDLIELMQEKTKGNLSEDESGLLVNVLHELRMLYVKAVG